MQIRRCGTLSPGFSNSLEKIAAGEKTVDSIIDGQFQQEGDWYSNGWFKSLYEVISDVVRLLPVDHDRRSAAAEKIYHEFIKAVGAEQRQELNKRPEFYAPDGSRLDEWMRVSPKLYEFMKKFLTEKVEDLKKSETPLDYSNVFAEVETPYDSFKLYLQPDGRVLLRGNLVSVDEANKYVEYYKNKLSAKVKTPAQGIKTPAAPPTNTPNPTTPEAP